MFPYSKTLPKTSEYELLYSNISLQFFQNFFTAGNNLKLHFHVCKKASVKKFKNLKNYASYAAQTPVSSRPNLELGE